MFLRKKIVDKKEQLLTEDDISKLKEIQRQAYMEEAINLAKIKGKDEAKKDYNKQIQTNQW